MSEKGSYKFPIFFFSVCFTITWLIMLFGYTYPFYMFFILPLSLIFGLWSGGGGIVYMLYVTNFNYILFYYYLGCLSWSIVLHYYNALNSENIRTRIKSIVLFFPFWLGISIFLGCIGPSSYTSSWLIFHIFLYIWVGVGFLYAINLMLGVISIEVHKQHLNKSFNSNESNKEMKKESRKLNFSRFLDFFAKYEFKILSLVILILGLYFIISSLIEFGNFNNLTSLYLFFTFLIITLQFDINYIIIFKKT